MRLLTELDALFTNHRACGDLDDAGVDGPTIWIDCECGAIVVRRVDEDERHAR